MQHMQAHTRKTLEAGFHHEYTAGGSDSAAAQLLWQGQETNAATNYPFYYR